VSGGVFAETKRREAYSKMAVRYSAAGASKAWLGGFPPTLESRSLRRASAFASSSESFRVEKPSHLRRNSYDDKQMSNETQGRIEGTNLKGPLQVKVVRGFDVVRCRFAGSVPIRSELNFSLEKSIFAEIGGKDLKKRPLDFFGGQRARSVEYGVKKLVEENVDGSKGFWFELYWTNV
jgi:hypothetical protein